MVDKDPTLWANLLAWLDSVKEQGFAATIAGFVAFIRSKYEGEGWWKSLLDALLCSVFGWFVKDELELLGVSDRWAYLASVFIGFLGTKYLGNLVKGIADRRAAK